MKTLNFIFLSFLFLISIGSFAQTANNVPIDTINNSLYKGSMSIQFGVSGNMTLGAFNDYSLSVKWHINDKSSLRFEIGGNISNNSGSVNSNGTNANVSYNQNNISLEMVLIYYISPRSKVNFFFGGGPIYNNNWSTEINPYVYRNQVYPNKTTLNGWGAGIKALAGAEWFFTKSMSLFAEYEMKASYNYNHTYTYNKDYEIGNIYVEDKRVDGFNLEANTARFGLSVYF